MTTADSLTIDRIDCAAYSFPTDAPESDGTLSWDSTTMLVVTVSAGGVDGIGYSYTAAPAAALVTGTLASVVRGQDAFLPTANWARMQHAIRNLGKPGVVASAVSAVDIALWDLYARLLDIPLSVALGAVHDAVPIYGSGGFTSYDDAQLAGQLADWVASGIGRVKMKVGRDPDNDAHRLAVARDAIGSDVELYVDANGAYARKQALWWARYFADHAVTWLEEPVSSDDLDGLHLIRDNGPDGMDIAAGEYGYDLPYFHRMLDADAVDCLQADVTRALGMSGVLRVAALCDARSMELSLHCAPQAGAHVGSAVWHLRHLEYFHDHQLIERRVFDGVLAPEPGGVLRPDRSRAGMGLTIRHREIENNRVA